MASYFNGGLGILLLALFGLLGQTNLNAMNGMKNVVSALLTAIAVAVYAWGGVVAWPQALVMMIAATAGGYFGARIARRISAPALRAGIVVHRFDHDRAIFSSRLMTMAGAVSGLPRLMA